MSARELQRVVDEFYSVHLRRKLRLNIGESEVIAYKGEEVGVCDFSTPYMVSVPVQVKSNK